MTYMSQPGPSRRYVILLITASALVSIFFVAMFRGSAEGTRHPDYAQSLQETWDPMMSAETLTGPVIASKLGNETTKAELGRAAWKLFHTTFARFPDNPTSDESLALNSYIHLFQRLYPCGECANHFRTIIDRFPPQVSSRSAAAAWGCHVHNEVNKSLKKPLFDCSNIGDFYDCGCADGEEESAKKESPSLESKVAAASHRTKKIGPDELLPVELAKEGYQRGG